MLNVIQKIDEAAIDRLFAVYAESMEDLQQNYADAAQMKAEYAAFLADFITDPKHLVLIEETDAGWVSGLRAIETSPGRWFLEAVETMPEKRHQGHGKELLLHTIEYLKCRGMREITCTIAEGNTASQALHKKCGFVPTDRPPLNPWGELEEGTILFCFSL